MVMELQRKSLFLSLCFLTVFVYRVNCWTGEIRGRVVCDVCADSSIGPEDHILEAKLHMHLGSTEKMNNVSFPSVPPGFEHKESSVGSDSGNDEEDHMTLEGLFSPNSKRKRCSTETARTSCAGSSNAGELNTGTGNELKTAVTALEQEEKQAEQELEQEQEQEQEQTAVEYTNQNEDQTAMEEEAAVVEYTNPNEAAAQVQKSEEEVGDHASKLIELSMAERSNFSARMKQIDSIRARVSNAERNFAEIKAAWERENEVYIQSQ